MFLVHKNVFFEGKILNTLILDKYYDPKVVGGKLSRS